MDLGPQAWENPLLSKVIQVLAQLISAIAPTHRELLISRPHITDKIEQSILTDCFYVKIVVLLSVPRLVCPDLYRRVLSRQELGDESDR